MVKVVLEVQEINKMREIESGMPCMICNQGIFHALPKCDKIITHREEQVAVCSLDSFSCSVCGESFYTRESEKRLDSTFAELRRSVNRKK